MSTSASIDFVGKGTLQKELQRTIAAVCWDEVNTGVNDQDKKYQLKIFFTSDLGNDDASSKGGRSLLRKKKQEEDNKKRSPAPTLEQNDVKAQDADTMTKVMKAGIAQCEANMQYQRNVVSVREDMMITQSRYNAAMGQNC